MKKFYTFEPKNFRIFSKMKSFLAVALLLLMAVGNVKAQTTATLVTNASDLAVGDQIILVGEKSGSYYAMSKTQKTNNRDGVAVTKTGNTISFGEDVQVIELEAGTVSNTFAMRVEYIENSTTTTGYLYAAGSGSGSKNYLRSQATKDNNGSWLFTLNTTEFKIVAQGTNDRTDLRFNENNPNTPLFACYKSSSETGELVSIYKVSTSSCTPVVRTEPVNLSVCTSPYQQVTFGKNNTVYASNRAEGEYLDTIAGVGGDCDTIVTVNFTLIPASYEKYDTIKAGEHYAFGDMDLTTTTNENYTFTASCGCDSTVYLSLTVLQPVMMPAFNDFVCAGKTYIYRGKNYTEANTYYDTVKMGAGINDTIYTLVLSVRDNATYAFDQTIKPGETWFFTDKYPSIATAGVYKDTLTAANTCDSIVTVTVSILEPVMKDPFNDFVCAGKTYIYRGKDYTEANTYYDTVKMGAGINDTIYTLVLSVRDNATYAFDQTIKQGETWFFTDKYPSIATDGVYTDTLAAANTCDSVVTVTVTVLQPVVLPAEDATTCEGKAYSFRDKDYTVADTYYDTVKMGAGINDTIYTLNLTVNPKATYAFDYSMDEGNTYDFFGDPITESGEYSHTLTDAAANGCDSVVTVNVTVIPLPDTIYEETVSICEGETYTFHTFEGDSICTETNIYTFTAPNIAQGGRDSIRILNLTVISEVRVDTAITICESDLPYTVFGRTYNRDVVTVGSHDFILHLESEGGCDSAVVYLNLTVGEEYDGEVVEKTICATELPYHFGPATQDTVFEVGTVSGNYPVHFRTVLGCDSTVTLALTVNPVYDEVIDTAICASELPFHVYGPAGQDSIYNETGTYVVTFPTLAGCDSTVTLKLTVNVATTGDTTAVACSSFDWYEHTGLTASGNYTHVFDGGNATGCDSTVTLHLTINLPSTGDTTATVCDSIQWYGTTYATSGDYPYVIENGNAAGCDSTVTLHLTVNHSTVGDTTAVACSSFDWYEHTGLTTSGDYKHVFDGGNAAGCDSTVTLHLTINLPSFGDTTATVCDSIQWYGNTYTTSGDYPHVFENGNAAGCDSTVTLHLTVKYSTVGDTNATVCGSFNWYEHTGLTTSGDYKHVFDGGNAAGCDSTVTLHLIVNPVYNVTDTLSICENELPYTYTTAIGHTTTIPATARLGVYDTTLVYSTVNDCDSTVVLNLTITPRSECMFVVHVDAGEHGTIVGDTMVLHGSNPEFVVKADQCYYIESIVKNGSAVPFDAYSLVDTVKFDSVHTNSNTLTATFAKFIYTVTATAHGEGTIDATATDLECDSNVVYHFAANTGYHIDSIKIDDEVTVYDDETHSEGTQNFNNIDRNHTIDVYYGINHYTVDIICGDHGTVTPSTTQIVAYGEQPVLTFAPASCFELRTITVNDIPIDTTCTTFTLDSIKENTIVKVAFDTIHYRILVTRGGLGHGTINGSYAEVAGTIACGTSFDFNVAADEGSYIDTIILYGGIMHFTNHRMTFPVNITEVDEDLSIYVAFGLDEERVQAFVDGGNGTITPNDTMVGYGTDCNLNVLADTLNGYHIATITSGETTWTPEGNEGFHVFTLANVTTDTTVRATFELNKYTVASTYVGEGTVVADSATVTHGNNMGFTIIAGACHLIDSVFIDGTAQTVTNIDTMIVSVDNVITPDRALRVVFSKIPYAMKSIYDHTQGTVTPDTIVSCGDSHTYNITPNTGYHVDTIYYDGHENFVTEQNSYTFTNIDKAHTIEVIFAVNQYQVTASTNGYGIVEPTTSQVAHGNSQTFAVFPNECYHINSITVNGAEYDLSNVTDGQKKYQRIVREEHFDNVAPSSIGTLGDCSHNSNTINPTSYNLANWSNSSVYASVGKLKVGTTSNKGKITISNLNLNGESYTVAFDAKGWNGSSNANVAVNSEIISVLGNDACELSPYSVTKTDNTNKVVIESAAGPDYRFYIDNLVITVTDSVKDAKLFTVSNITEVTNVVVNFAIDTFQLKQVVSGNGTVNGMTDTVVNTLCGSDYIFNIVADEGNHIVDYTVNNGTPITIDNTESYITTATDTIKNIHENDTIAATFAVNTYTITAVEVEGEGSFDHDQITVEYDADTMIIVTANNAHGYHIASIDATNIHREYTNDDHKIVDTVYFTDVRANDTLRVKFALDLHLISVVKHGEGTVHPMDTNITFGDTVTFNITPADCQYISNVTVDGRDTTITDPEGMEFTFYSVVDTHRLEVTFAPKTYLVKWKLYYPGMPSVRDDSNVVCGTDFVYEIRAEEGFHIHEVYVDYVADTTFETEQIDAYDLTINDVRETHLIEVQFEQDYYSLHLAVNPTEGGTIVCDSSDLSKIYYNTPLQFTMTPDPCYELTGLTINNVDYFGSVVNNVLTWNAIDSGEVLATYTIFRYEMAAEYDNTKGTVNSGNMPDTVDCGATFTYTIAALEGYHIDTITIGDSIALFGQNDDINTTLVIENATSDTLVHVAFAINTYNVTVCTPAPEHGTLTVNPATVNHGANSEVTIVADAANGYHIDTIKCGDEVVEVFGANDSISYVYTFANITSDTSICATFSLNNYMITASTGDEFCTITPVGDTNVHFGDTVVYTIKPVDDCHYISTIVIDDTTTINYNDSAAYIHPFEDIRDNHTIVANSAIYRYTVTTMVNDNTLGEITPGDTTLDCGANYTYEVTPITGYHIISVTQNDGEQVIADSSTFTGTITDIHANDTVIATFGINHYTITSTNGEHGTIAALGSVLYEYGMTPTYTITPDPCYYIDEVTVDGTAVELTTGDSTSGTYTFSALDNDHTINVTFAMYYYAMTAEYDNWMGTVTTSDAQECGSEYKYIIDANVADGYHIYSYTINGVTTYNTMTEPNDYVTDTVTISVVSQDTNLIVVFDTNTYTVTACTGVNGTLEVTGLTEVNHNESTTVKVVADYANGYHIVSITDGRGNDVNLGGNTDTVYTYNVNNVTEDIVVCATFALDTFKITSSLADANGTITPMGDSIVIYGDVVDYVIEPNDCYYISNVVVDGTSVWTNGTDSVSPFTYTFNTTDFAPEEVNHTISAAFTIFEYTMTSNVYGNGTVTPTTTVNCGTDYTYEITADEGYHIDHVVLDNVSETYEGQQTTATVSVTNVHADHQLDVHFAINHYTVTATAGENGTITPSGVTTVEHGATLTYTITPNSCYYIDSVLVNEEPVAITDITGMDYTFDSVEDTMTIRATFHIYEYRMMAEYVETMGVVDTATVTCGSNYTYTIHANEGYHITGMRVGTVTHNNNVGLNTDTLATFKVYDVYQDTVCYVDFARNTYTVNFNVTGEGTVNPTTATVEYDSTLAYTVTASTGYHIVSITDNGETVMDNGTRDDVNYTGSIANIRENHEVNVVFAINEYTITATAGAEGEVIPGTQTVNYDETATVTIRTTEDCYFIDTIYVDNEVAMVLTDNETRYVYTFDTVHADHQLNAHFGLRTYTVIVNADSNGTVNPSEDTTTLNCGDDITYTFTPNAGYEVVSVTVNGTNMGAQTSYTITDIAADYTIDVVFGRIMYTLTSEAINHGTITPLGEITVPTDTTFTYTVTPDNCYTVDNLLVNGVSYMNNEAFDGETLTFDTIPGDIHIQAYFQIMKYTVETEATVGGHITETAVYNCGTDVTINITPEACYNLDSVVVDGVDQGAITEVAFNALDTNHTVNAYFSIKTFIVTASVNDTMGGTITATDTFNCGEAPVYEIVVNEGYHLTAVEVDGQEVERTTSYIFGSLDDDHTIEAFFEINTYTLTAHANAGVEILPADGDSIVEFGDTVTYTFNVDSCYEITSIMVDGEEVAVDTFYTFFDVAANHTLMVNATEKTYTITATAHEGGSITPAGETTVTCNGTQSFSITPAAGYNVDSVLVDGENVGAVNNYVFSGVTEDHTIEVIFTAIDTQTYIIHAEAGENGTITPEGDSTVQHGASVTYVFTADEYYTIDSVIVDGRLLPTPQGSYTFVNVTADHTIRVTFVADQIGCLTPNNYGETDITCSSATLVWSDTEAASYTVRYKKIGDTSYTVVPGITTTTYNLTGLEAATDYVWSVKAVCVDSIAESMWSVSHSFTTLAATDTSDIQSVDMNAINVYSYGNDIYVTNESNEQIKDVQVYDINGRLIHKGMAQSNPEVINVTAANGIYIVRVVTDTMVRNFKVSITQR